MCDGGITGKLAAAFMREKTNKKCRQNVRQARCLEFLVGGISLSSKSPAVCSY